MSKNPQPTKQQKPQAQSQSQGQQFPVCKNKKQAMLVCLNPDCNQYAFFCTACENDECEVIHHHGKKLESVSFKQYIKRVIKDKMIDDDLQEALNRYAECLEKLKKDVEQFVEKQLNQLEQIRKKASQVGEQQQKILQKLRKKEYNGLKGSQLDRLWQKMSEFDKKDKNKDSIQFLSIKQEQIKQISDNFEKVNKMELQDYIQEGNQKSEDQSKQKTQSKLSNNSKVIPKQTKQIKDTSKIKKQEPPAVNNSSTAKNTTTKKK